MKRSIARGRVFPQSYSTDRRYGRLSLKAIALFPLMWANGDDQGRLSGDPEEVKYAVCPNVDHITKKDIPDLIKELQDNKLILSYDTPKSAAIQLLDWWDTHQRLQWAWPSEYKPPDGWLDHLRYKKDAHTVVTENWPVSGEGSGEQLNSSQVSDETLSGENSSETSEISPLETPSVNENVNVRGNRKRKRNSPESQKASQVRTPTPTSTFLLSKFMYAWGKYPDSREQAQLRDLEKEISSAGGATEAQIEDAFREAAVQNKLSVSYVRAVLLDWLGVKRPRSP